MNPASSEKPAMLAASVVRTIIVLIGLSGLGCATGPELRVTPPHGLSDEELLALEPLPSQCPFANVYIAVTTNGAELDEQVAERVQLAYAEHLGVQGFAIAPAPEEAYWSAFSLVAMSRQASATFVWSVYMMATQDLAGRVPAPFRFAAEGDERDDLSGFMLLREVHLQDVDGQARSAAEATAGALLPHAARMCIVWTQNEELREELAQEILRVREERQQSRKRLQLDVDQASDS